MAAAVASTGAAQGERFEAGRRLYHGIGSDVQACASCHGLSGQGGSEGGTVIPPIQPLFGASGAYPDAAALCRAVNHGVAPGARPLARSMPRYRLAESQCDELWQYLARRSDQVPPGIDDVRIVVRLVPAPVTPGQIRWRDILQASFAEFNQNGGAYGRRVALTIGEEPAAFEISLAALQAREGGAAIRIAIRNEGADPATRGIEGRLDDETTAMLRHLAASGARRLLWLDERRTGVAPDELALMAGSAGLELAEASGCSEPGPLHVVIQSWTKPLPPACAKAAAIYASLRSVPLEALGGLLSGTDFEGEIGLFAPLPLDAAFSAAPSLVGDIVLSTVREMTARPSELRQLEAFDRAWRQHADTRQSLYAGVGIQMVTWPSLAPRGAALWVPRAD